MPEQRAASSRRTPEPRRGLLRVIDLKSPAEHVASKLPDKNALVVTYCSNLKCPASGKLAAHLRSLGYSNVVEYPEGIQGWTEAGHPVDAVAN